MSRKLVFALYLFVFLSAPVLIVRFTHVEVKAPTGYPVHNLDTGLNYTTIQEAIDANETDDGHTIFVEEGIYYEHVVVNKSISLIGENKYNTVIDGNRDGIVIKVVANNVNISGFTIQESGYYIIIEPEPRPIWFEGIYIDHSCGNNINHNIIANNGYGIRLYCSNSNILTGINALDNHDGIRIESSSNNALTGNDASSNTKYGIYIVDSNNNSLLDNIASKNDLGIELNGYSNNNILIGNIASNNDLGIRLTDSNNNTLSGNTVSSNQWSGIHLTSSLNNTLSDNKASNNDYGISLSHSSSNTLCGNTVSSNDQDGIYLSYSGNNSLFGNNISNNDNGIYLFSSNKSMIYHNNFISNVQQIISINSTNTWDNGFEGNFWSNYTGVDTDHDGIGDTEHVIDVNNTDHYPLMGTFTDYTVTSELHVQTICNSSISDFQFNGTAISFNVTGINDTAGFCRICIPKALMNDTFRVYVNGTEILPSPEPLPCSNTTHTYLYFIYNHSTQEVIIVPEFPSLMILPLFMIAILLKAVVYRRKPKSQT